MTTTHNHQPIAGLKPQIRLLNDLPNAHPVIRYAAQGNDITVSATDGTTVMAVTLHLEEPVPHNDTVTAAWPSSKSEAALSRTGWMIGARPAHDYRICRHSRLTIRGATRGRSVTLEAQVLDRLLVSYIAALDADTVVLDTHGAQLRAALNTSVIRGVATLAGALSDGPAATAAVPMAALRSAVRSLDGSVRCTISNGRVALSGSNSRGQQVIIVFDTSAAAGALPSLPNPDRRRHDVRIQLADWVAFAHNGRRPVHDLDQAPTAHLRLAGSSDNQVLAVDTRQGGQARHVDIACSTSDRFSIDLALPALTAVLRPAVQAGAASVVLRAFDPNPTLTPLVVTYTGRGYSGWMAAGARKPLSIAA